MSHYCCKRCGQRYEYCDCPLTSVVGVQPSTAPQVPVDEEPPEDIREDDLACHQTLGQMRMHLDFLILAFGEDTVVDFSVKANNVLVELIPDPNHEG